MKYIKYLLLWLISVASAFGAHYAPIGQECGEIARCSSMPEVIFTLTAVFSFAVLVFLIIHNFASVIAFDK